MEYSLIHIIIETFYDGQKVAEKIIGIFKDYDNAQKYIKNFGNNSNDYSYDIKSIYSDI